MIKTTLLLATLLICSTIFSQTADSIKKKLIEVSISPSIGVGLIRYTPAPSFNLGLVYSYKDSWKIGLNSSSYFFFEPIVETDNTKDYKMSINTFINGEFLTRGLLKKEKSKDWNGIGIGYLIDKNGDCFHGSTAKLYFIHSFKRHITVLPEIIFTNDFNTIFPGVTIRF